MRIKSTITASAGIAMLALTLSACGDDGIKSVKMPDGKVWMAKNLDNAAVDGSNCYNGDIKMCMKCGSLYDWETAIKACPKGWHLPTEAEFENLIKAVGGEETAGTVLKSKERWNNNGNGTDNHGFSMLPCGAKDSDGNFERVGDQGILWCAEAKNERKAHAYVMNNNNSDIGKLKKDKTNLYSVRCVKD